MSCGADILMIAFGYSFSRFCVELLIHVAEKYDDRTIWKTFLDWLRSLDIFLVDGTTLKGFPAESAPTNHLYRNNRDGSFTDPCPKLR